MVRGPLEEISPRDQEATAGSPSRTRSAVTTVSGRITVSGTACADAARRMNPNGKITKRLQVTPFNISSPSGRIRFAGPGEPLPLKGPDCESVS